MILANHGIVSSSGSVSFDADALAFITAASITDNTQKTAVNTLVTDLKNANIWTKMKAIYPFVGGTATSHKWNLKDPRDLDAAYRLVFSGGWTHSSTGALPNGTTAYADTKLIPSSNLTKPFIGYYSRTNTNTGITQIDMGNMDSTRYLWISAWYNTGGLSNILARNSSAGVLLDGGITNDSRGWYWTNKIGTTAKIGKNSTILNTASDTDTPPSIYTVAIGCLMQNTGPAFYTNRETAFSIIADGMSDTDTTNLYTAVQTFQTTLGRQV